MAKRTLRCGIYIIKNIKNRRVYIGSSVDLHGRELVHFRKLRKGVHDNSHLQAAYNLYGKSEFVWEELCEVSTLFIRATEQSYLDYFWTWPHGCYNEVRNVGKVWERNRKHATEEQRRQAAAAKARRYYRSEKGASKRLQGAEKIKASKQKHAATSKNKNNKRNWYLSKKEKLTEFEKVARAKQKAKYKTTVAGKASNERYRNKPESKEKQRIRQQRYLERQYLLKAGCNAQGTSVTNSN